MNTNSHYRNEIIQRLLMKKKMNRVASKSKKGDISVKEEVEEKKEMPMHISLKTPILNLTDDCSQYTYNIDATINTDLSQIPSSTGQICFCIFRVIHCREQQNVQMPFLEYLLYKYPHSTKKESNLMVFPFIKGGGSIKKKAEKHVKIITAKNLKIKGFVEINNSVYLFFNYSEDNDNLIKRVFYKTKNDNLWWCLMDEICNHKKVLNFPIHPSVYNLFYRNPSLIYLKQKDKRIDTPIVGYYGNYSKFLPMVAALGQNAAISMEGAFEDSFFFGSFRKAIRYGAWSPFYRQRTLFGTQITDIDGLYHKGGIIRFALFMGKTKVLLDEPYDKISDYITGKKTWKNTYQSVFMASTEFDGENINIPPEYILKNFEQQVPLSYHEIDKTTLKTNWDPHYKGYGIV